MVYSVYLLNNISFKKRSKQFSKTTKILGLAII